MSRKAQTVIEQRKREASQQLGISQDRIQEMSLQLSALRQNGVLVDLTITGVRMFQRTHSWAEVGVQADEKDPIFKQFTRGQKYLIPQRIPDKLKSWESRLRQMFAKYTLSVSGLGDFRFLSYKVYPKFRDEYQGFVSELEHIKAELEEEYPTYEETVRTIYTAIAETAWSRAMGAGYDWLIVKNKAYNDRDEFIREIVESAVSLIPSIERIRKELTVDYITALAFGADEAAEAESRARVARTRAEEEARALRLVNEQEAERIRHERFMHQQEEALRLEQIAEMHRIEREHYEQQLRTIVSPYDTLMQDFRDRMASLAAEALKSVQGQGFVRGKVAEGLVGMLELNELMNAHNDLDLHERMARLRSALGPVGEERKKNKDVPKRDATVVASALEEIINLALSEKRAAAGSQFSLLEMDDEQEP